MSSKPLGFVSKKYESGRSGPGTISSGRGDPGGKSYGSFQLASKTGTLQRYIASSKYKSVLGAHPVGSLAFDQAWKKLALEQPENFESDQHDFIVRTHYVPVRLHGNLLNIPSTLAINEALYSISVQHGGAKRIINAAHIKPTDSEREIIMKLYTSRRNYVKRYVPKSLHNSLLNRYKNEERDVLALLG